VRRGAWITKAASLRRKELEVFEGFEDDLSPKGYGRRTLKAGRIYALIRQGCRLEDPWHVIVVATCSFEETHAKDGWEFVLGNRLDTEDIGQLFERAHSSEEFEEGLKELKERDLEERLEKNNLA
jgi:hypothetical protein